MMAPEWLNEVVADFGRQMGLNGFALNERGTAGVRFENGITFRLEYANEALMMIVGFIPTNAEDFQSFAAKLLTVAHYEAAGSKGIRVGFLKRSGEAIATARISERELDVPKMEEKFGLIWQTAMETGAGR
ncbi:MAG: hypothetical protein MJ109_05860 [Kiritimatiellae bacterium]|nr:hypothetical protein [Kiritimatiellia bacterium]